MVDTCGWIAVIDAGINIDHAFTGLFGKFDFIVIDSVWEELKIFEENNNSKNILLTLLKKKSLDFQNKGFENKHTDDILLFLSKEKDWPVLTVDRKLKERLHASNCKVIQVVSGKKIEFVS